MDLNRANRQCADLDIREYATNKPWMFADFCNTTTAGFSGDSVFAMKKGSKAIAFHNPIEGTMTVEFQVHPFKVYALLSDGEILTDAIVPVRKTVACTSAGVLTVTGEVAVAGTVFAYAKDDIGGTPIIGTAAITTDTVFTATTPANIAVGTSYEICYLVNKTTGVKRIAFNDKKIPKDFRITQETVDKDENGNLVPFLITAYKATPKRNLELSLSSEGDPASIKIEFDVLQDKEGNVLDIVEITE
jgi:hypothetical protein